MNRRPEKDMDNPPGQIVNKVTLPRCASNVACACSPGRCEDKDYGPGQVRYLRDVIRKYQEEDRGDEKVYKAISDRYATSLSPSAEKRLDDLQRGLLRLCRQSEDPDYPTRGGWRGWLRARDIHDLLKESL
jgi:hypothetical protein